MISMTAHATREIEADPTLVWVEAGKLRWLQEWDTILVQAPPALGGEFWLQDEGLRVKCTWTTVDAPRSLAWLGDNGCSGTMTFQAIGRRTLVTYQAVFVAPTATDKVIAGFMQLVAKKKLQEGSDKSAGRELWNLANRVARSISGNPVDDNERRQMIDLCLFGSSSNDPDVVPRFGIDGHLELAGGEQIVWSGAAASIAAEDAKAASGAEQWNTMWQSPDPAELILTTERMVYVIPKFTRADGSLILLGGITGAALVGLSELHARTQRAGKVLAGQIRHLHLLTLITGANSRPTFSSPSTITATVLQLPDRLLRVSVTTYGPLAALELAGLWTKNASADRIQRFAHLKDNQSDKWIQLQHQYEAPSSQSHHYGDSWMVPLGCALTRTHPYGIPQRPTS